MQPPTRSSARGTRGHLPSPHLHHFVHCSVFDSDRHVGTPWWHPSPPPPPNTCVQSNLLPVPPPIGPYARPTSGGSDVCRCGVRGRPWRCPSAPPVLCCPISRCNISGLGGAAGGGLMSVVGVHFSVSLSGSSARCWCSPCCPTPPHLQSPGGADPSGLFPPPTEMGAGSKPGPTLRAERGSDMGGEIKGLYQGWPGGFWVWV